MANKAIGDHSIGRFDDDSNRSINGHITQLQYVPLTPKVQGFPDAV